MKLAHLVETSRRVTEASGRLEKIKGEWRLVCLTPNLLKLWRYGCAAVGT